MQHEYNHEYLDQSGVFLPDPMGENYENTVDQIVTDDNYTNAIESGDLVEMDDVIGKNTAENNEAARIKVEQ